MAASDCSGALSLALPYMDRARDEFFELLAQVDKADNARLPSAWRNVVDCAAENFACEDVWMKAIGHAARKEHDLQHRVVLGVMREGVLQAEEGRLLQVREMARQLRGWYEKHVRTMDAALALELRGTRVEAAKAGHRSRTSPPVWTALCETVEQVTSH